ncbi:hypothetical protein BDY17DRAFT_308541 [Neohortaea acidophila]|uniref:Uncharacterized protein n=1 Tax=Neohortaea acidophila TaxID=245834 RepID=A0A6A6Q0Z7_9PEZI|nr:uncharacterized protein BDY17DRAFT_308541 [Neohortaea acidophila]KAF2485087.1 hypothetical protein BDY17DRAFT_308541 [Neohortaea acidophila]
MAHTYTKNLPRLITTFCDAPRPESMFLSNEFWEAVYLDPGDSLDNMSMYCCNDEHPYYDVEFNAFDETGDLEDQELEAYTGSQYPGSSDQIQSAGTSPITPAIVVSQDGTYSASGTDSPRSVASSLVCHGGLEFQPESPWPLSPKEPCKPATSTPPREQHPNEDRSPSHITLASSLIQALMRLCRAPTNPSTPDSIAPDQGSAVSEFPLDSSWTQQDVSLDDQRPIGIFGLSPVFRLGETAASYGQAFSAMAGGSLQLHMNEILQHGSGHSPIWDPRESLGRGT